MANLSAGRFSMEMSILPSMCDATTRLDPAFTSSLFMDVASEHAEVLGIGGAAMTKKGLFWLTVRTKYHFLRRPFMMEKVTASTWPAQPKNYKCLRYYTLKSGDETLIEGKTDWAVLDTKTGGLYDVSQFYDATVPPEEKVCSPGFARIDQNFSGCTEKTPYIVKSTDIDFGGHMNNAAYARAILGEYTSKELKAMDIKEMEISFRSPCFEGEVLSIFERKTENGTELGIFHPDGKCAALSLIVPRI